MNHLAGDILNLTIFFMTGLGLLVGGLLGAGLYALWLRQKEVVRLRPPAKWPLAARGLITTEEHQVLNWLRQTFHDHLVMVKLPVLRFTIPTEKKQKSSAQRWQDVLNGVYCTFTVCTTDGTVVGCIDVPGKRGFNKTGRELKEALLSDCRIAYTVVRSTHMPDSRAMRAAFLGELAVEDEQDTEVMRGGDTSFNADLDNFTQQKRFAAKEAALKQLNQTSEVKPGPVGQPTGFNADGTAAARTSASSDASPQWEDSFTMPADTRPAKLD